MLGSWLQDIESLEAIHQDVDTCALVLRMAAMSREGTLRRFLEGLGRDVDVDDDTKGTVFEIAQDETFLLAVEDYVARTRVCH